jgi:peptidoglycan/LPS O-acetylase OafA/YrhL
MPASAPQDLKPLTALRFAAAMWVVAYHYWPALNGAARPAVLAKGYLGVELFFVLSGFILSHVYLTSFGEKRFSWRGFLWARLARIYPLHLATLAGIGLLVAGAALLGVQGGSQALVWSSLPAQLSLTQAWGLGLGGGWNHPSWSISAEWFAYLSFPAFAWAAWKLRRRPRLAVLAALALMVGLEAGFPRLAGFPLTEATIAWGALRIVPCFAYGCAIWLAWRAARVLKPALAVAWSVGSLLAIVLAVLAGAPDMLDIALFGALIFGLARLAASGSRLLSGPVGVYLGEVSFAVYMTCIPWNLAFQNGAHKLLHLGGASLGWPLWSLMFAGVVPVAMAAHHLVERPAREAMRAWQAAGFPLRRESVLKARIRRILEPRPALG